MPIAPDRLKKLKNEAAFLRPQARFPKDFIRVFRIANEFFRGFWLFSGLGPAVSIFGSARFGSDSPFVPMARALGAALAQEGYAVITGGGPGIMEAANQGAFQAGGKSLGVNIVIPQEQTANPYLHSSITFNFFFVRKVILVKYSSAFVFLPGGLGTIDELGEVLTLLQTGKVRDFPVVLMGVQYWKGFLDWCRDTLLAQGAISEESLSRLLVTDNVEETVRFIRESHSDPKRFPNHQR